MTKEQTSKRQNTYLFIAIAVFFILLIFLQSIDIHFSDSELVSSMIQNIIFRIVGGVLFILLMISSGLKHIFTWKKPFLPALLVIIPGLIIAVNNFPIIAYFDGRAVLTEPVSSVVVFAIESFSVAFFEEIIFRGLILVLLVRMFSKTKTELLFAIVLSSSFFGFMHLWNLFSGAGFFSTILQVGYSFLMGMLWSVVFLKTRNIWLAIFLHASYNFFGILMSTLGVVDGQFDPVTIVITALLSIGVAITMFYIFLQIDTQEISQFCKE